MRILLIEDEVRLARNYQRNLTDEGHTVEVIHDGETAAVRLRKEGNDYDVIVLDVLLPGCNGIDLCRSARRAGLRTPILLLTALDQTEMKVRGLDAGADDYLTKPFPFDELLARLRALVRRPHRYDPVAEATHLQVGPLYIDLLRHEVWRDGDLIAVTPREYSLLEYLARNPNRVLTRQQLMNRLWPDGTLAASNVLDTYMHYLRDKIDRDYAEPLLRTVRGVGYMLCNPTPGGERARRH
ncbi:MAG: response regulator transcription factor [Ktedonobacterales bacterium]